MCECVNVTWFWTPVTITIPRVWRWLRSPILSVCQVRALRFASGGDNVWICWILLNNWLAQILSPRVPQNPSKTETHFVCRFSKDKVSESAETLDLEGASFRILPAPCICSILFVCLSVTDVCAALRHHTYRHPLRWPEGQPQSSFFFLRHFEMLSSSFSKIQQVHSIKTVLPCLATLCRTQ